MTEESLDDEIDALAMNIEKKIADGEEYLENEAPEFDPKHRRMEEADTASLFS